MTVTLMLFYFLGQLINRPNLFVTLGFYEAVQCIRIFFVQSLLPIGEQFSYFI